MGYKTVGSFGHSSMVMLTSQLSSTWCTESIRRYVTFRKKHLSREKAYLTGELTAVQQHTHHKRKLESSFPVAAETLADLGGNAWGVYRLICATLFFLAKLKCTLLSPSLETH